MNKIISITVLMCTLFIGSVIGQQISDEAYNKKLINEDFNTVGDIFKIITTTDNYFILDNGDYLLSRNNNESEYAIIANNSFSSDFVLKTQLRIGPSLNKEASIGIILKAQEDGKGAIIFEINNQGEYRIKQLKGSSYNILSENKQNNGWIRNKMVNGVDIHNLVEIRTEDYIYDVYINNTYITTFFIPDYKSGYAGLIVTASTKARISYFYLNAKNNISQNKTNINNETEPTAIAELNEKIKSLEENNSKLDNLYKKINIEQENIINTLNEKNSELEAITLTQKEQIETLKEENQTNSANKNSELEKIIKENKILISKLNKEKGELQANIMTSNSQNNTLKAEINKLQTKNIESSSILLMNEKEIKILEKENKNLKTKNSNEREVSKQLHDQISALKIKLSAESKITNNLNKQISELRKQISEERESNALREGELKKHNASNSILIKNLNNEVTVLKKEITNLKTTEANFNTLNNELSSTKDKLNTLKATNNELTELFIQKEYEANGVDPSDVITKTTLTDPEKNVESIKSKDLLYAIQIGVYTNMQSESNLSKLEQLWYETTLYGTYVYYSGQFKSPQEATAHKNTLVSLGYPNAFVVTLTK